jgi:hypothetical protein
MTAVIVYSFQAWDQSTGEYKLSRRMATRKGIELCNGTALEDTAIEIDSSQLERGEECELDPAVRTTWAGFSVGGAAAPSF